MTTHARQKFGPGVRLLAALMVLGSGAAHADSLPATTGTVDASTGTRTFNLWAMAGTTTPPGGAALTIWGYSESAGGPVLPGGPILIVNQGETVQVNLTNLLPESTAILFQGQSMAPDLAGAGPGGGVTSYTFTASNAGTFLYEAGLLPGATHHSAMGLHGALIVRPLTAGQAYEDARTAYVDEALLVLSELDPALSLNPSAFDMRNFAPKYFLINGAAYPATAPIPATAGNTVLLRLVNAGVQQHSMTVLGLQQTLVAKDGNLLAYSGRRTAETIAPGETVDAIVTVPAGDVDGTRYAVFDGTLMLHNNGGSSLGGMLTFLSVDATTGPPGTDVAGPDTTFVSVTPGATNGTVDVALAATVSDVAKGGGNVVAAEYFIDVPGANGSGAAMGGTFGSPTVAVSATIGAATLGAAAMASGTHTLYVHGQDSLGNWGGFNLAVLNLDKAGPATTGLALAPNPANGSVGVALSATGNDTASGNSSIQAAEYFIDPVGTPAPGTGSDMVVNAAAPVASLTATIPSGTVSGLSAGTHVVSVRSRDASGNWGPFNTVPITLVVDRTGPAVSNVVATPNPTNGTTGANANTPAIRVTADFADASGIVAAEGFIDTPGANGTGFPFLPTDGQFSGPSEKGFGDISLATIRALTDGNHTLFVHGKDAAGNWGTLPAGAGSQTTLRVDKTGPTFPTITVNPASRLRASTSANVTVSGTVTDAISGVKTGPGAGTWTLTDSKSSTVLNGTFTILQNGTFSFSRLISRANSGPNTPANRRIYTFTIRVQDNLGNVGIKTASYYVQ